MKTSIATVSISGTLREKLLAISNAGFDGIEIFEQDFIADEGSPKEIGNLIRDHGLEITLFQPFRDFEGLTGSLRQKAFDRARYKFETMNALGVDRILVCSSVHPEAVGGIDRAADDLSELGEIAKSYNVRVGYEALAWGKHVNDHRDAWEIVRRADHPNIGLILDSFHTLARKTDPNTIRQIPSDKILFVQLADAPLIDMDLLYWSRHFRNMPGEGDLAVVDFMRAVAATGYNDTISLEIFNDQFRGGLTTRLARDGYRSLAALIDDVQKLEPDTNFDVPKLPNRITVEGIEFVEFTTQGKQKEALETMLESMGFQRVGEHKSKNVSVWKQGEIRIVLNEESSGFASSVFATQGTSVCDIGLRVSSAVDTITRSKALGANLFSQPQEETELEIPAVKSVGAGVLHFIDGQSDLSNVWETEFDAVSVGAAGDAGLSRIDHLAETMAYDQMLSWSLFYTSIFDMHKEAMNDVIDPDGLVRSQAISSKDKRTRITLNGADTHRTLAGKFLADTFGNAVQHVAFQSNDIFKSAQDMKHRGFKALKMNENYYRDVQARFALSDEETEKLKEYNILYDEDETGSFYQFYSMPISSGFFFEIVERRSGYDGYGAPNAPFRIAAQKRVLGPKGLPKV